MDSTDKIRWFLDKHIRVQVSEWDYNPATNERKGFQVLFQRSDNQITCRTNFATLDQCLDTGYSWVQAGCPQNSPGIMLPKANWPDAIIPSGRILHG